MVVENFDLFIRCRKICNTWQMREHLPCGHVGPPQNICHALQIFLHRMDKKVQVLTFFPSSDFLSIRYMMIRRLRHTRIMKLSTVVCFFALFPVIGQILSVISLNQNETSFITQQTNTKRRKPILYIHVGPPKTATTSIQSTLTHHKNELLENGILYLGKSIPRVKWVDNFPHPAYCTMYQQFSERSQKITPTCVDVLNQTLVQYYSESVRSIYANDEKEEDEGLESHKITSTHQKTGQSSVRDIIMSCEVIGIMFSSSGRVFLEIRITCIKITFRVLATLRKIHPD